MINEVYRRDYEGEFIITNSTWTQGKKIQEREFIPNPIVNQHISGRAACIGHSIDRDQFDFTRLQRHRGGLLGTKKLQTYGVGELTADMRLDFAVETDGEIINDIKNRQYYENNIVYTTPRICLANPGSFYFIPYNPKLAKEAQLVYLACFDGHSEVFLLGYTTEAQYGFLNVFEQVISVMNSYKKTRFFIVARSHQVPSLFLELPNVQAMNYREFFNYCDV